MSSEASSEISKEIGRIADFTPGKSREVMFGGRKVLVARLSNGEWSAVSAVCTHLGCSVKLDRDGNEDVFACNCHNSKFSLDGTNLSGPAPLPLRRFDVEVKGDRVIVSARSSNTSEQPVD
jgi:cytochrome b6-f complex iron-sulfur subunit